MLMITKYWQNPSKLLKNPFYHEEHEEHEEVKDMRLACFLHDLHGTWNQGGHAGPPLQYDLSSVGADLRVRPAGAEKFFQAQRLDCGLAAMTNEA